MNESNLPPTEKLPAVQCEFNVHQERGEWTNVSVIAATFEDAQQKVASAFAALPVTLEKKCRAELTEQTPLIPFKTTVTMTAPPDGKDCEMMFLGMLGSAPVWHSKTGTVSTGQWSGPQDDEVLLGTGDNFWYGDPQEFFDSLTSEWEAQARAVFQDIPMDCKFFNTLEEEVEEVNPYRSTAGWLDAPEPRL